MRVRTTTYINITGELVLLYRTYYYMCSFFFNGKSYTCIYIYIIIRDKKNKKHIIYV